MEASVGRAPVGTVDLPLVHLGNNRVTDSPLPIRSGGTAKMPRMAESESLPTPPGDSREQRNAEAVMVALLADELGVPLAPRRIELPSGGRVEIDAASADLSVLCEAWAHQGAPKVAQRNKVVTDAFKLAFVAQTLGGPHRLIILLSDEAAAAPFRGQSWYAGAMRDFGVELAVVELPADVRDQVRTAQARQYR